MADLELPLAHTWVGQGNGASDHRDPEFLGQAAEQHLIVTRHGRGFHAQVGVVGAVIARGADPGTQELQGIAQRQPVHRVLHMQRLVHLVFFAGEHQPSADVFRQYHNGLFVDQALVPCVLQVGRKLQVQAFQALVVGGE